MAAGEINKGCIFFFIKSPEQTTVKSRLAEAVGSEKARELYRNFVLDMLETLSDVVAGGQHDLWVCFYPPEAGQEIHDWLGSSYTCVPQQGNDLGERMQNAFLAGFTAGYRRAILLGSDTPDLTSAIITAALSRLNTHPAVIGPACDGGYYLLGFQSQAFLPAIFCGIPWSTGEVYTRTREVFRRTHTHVFILPPWRDIDTIADLQDLQESCHNSSFARSRTMRYLLEVNEHTAIGKTSGEE
jgi:rSAM/selenodomain-associated transferase 1